MEKSAARIQSARQKAPQASAADALSVDIQTLNGPFRVLMRWLFDGRRELEPITNGINFAKGDTGLYHAEWTGVHSQKNDFFLGTTEVLAVGLVHGPGVGPRVVNGVDAGVLWAVV